ENTKPYCFFQVMAIVGEHIILPCHLEPAVDARSMAVEWTRPDLKPRLVLVWRAGQKLNLDDKNPSYRGRTTLLTDKLKSGDISLKLFKVKLSDRGKYKCYVPSLNRDSVCELVVGKWASLKVFMQQIVKPPLEMFLHMFTLVLQCESKGWYPEPELLWLDAEGKILSAGPTETVRGPDDLYTVSSTVTVEKRHSNNITCRVQQRNINQIRETQIKVKGDFFPPLNHYYRAMNWKNSKINSHIKTKTWRENMQNLIRSFSQWTKKQKVTE
uniref:Ig-like domain-containing protein n=1 Tax=Anabas testudineus TaxID=64144 RepID=A0A3Q1JDB8_ANATE